MTTPIEASGHLDADDARILAEIREISSRVDPVPASLTERVKYAMTVRMLEAEVAELIRMPMAVARSEVGERVDSISFTGSRLSLMVSLTTEADGVRVDCWVTHGGALVEVHRNGGSNDAGQAMEQGQVCDEHGRCVFTELPPGPVHFIVWPDQDKLAQPIITPTINL
ncbi:MAG: hypothetical protein WBG76_12865 [Ornithinimicrobium sp.]